MLKLLSILDFTAIVGLKNKVKIVLRMVLFPTCLSLEVIFSSMNLQMSAGSSTKHCQRTFSATSPTSRYTEEKKTQIQHQLCWSKTTSLQQGFSNTMTLVPQLHCGQGPKCHKEPQNHTFLIVFFVCKDLASATLTLTKCHMWHSAAN